MDQEKLKSDDDTKTHDIEITTDPDEKKDEEELQDLGGIMRLVSEFGRNHKCFVFFGLIGSMGNGAVFPFFAVLFQEMFDMLYGDDIVKEALNVMIYWFVLGIAALIFNTFQYAFFGRYGAKIGMAVRRKYFKLLLSQEVGYHDVKNSGTLNSDLVSNTMNITDALGGKIGFLLQQIVQIFCGFGLAFYYSWDMTLVLLATTPAMVCVGVVQTRMFMAGDSKTDPFTDANSFSNEVLLNIRTVAASPALLREKIQQYADLNAAAFPVAKSRSAAVGFGLGALMLVSFGVMDAIGLWYGSVLVDKGEITVGDMFGCFFSLLFGGIAMGQLGAVAENMVKCKMAAKVFYNLEARERKMKPPRIETPINKGREHLKGRIEFKNVSFAYPSAPQRVVLDNVSFVVEPGKSLAIVGPSGSGKSTIVALTEKFYDSIAGEILIDGVPIENYDEGYLRGQMGYVSQLPLLFDESIEQNIRAGDSSFEMQDIVNAATFADAHEFIEKLPDKYETQVGQMGVKLSGGQKQRICIARAIANKPCIILLDEATSALDTKSEREVQRALDKIADTKSQTIIAIAHRLSTIKNADEIIVLVDGEINERGTHQVLIDQNGVYAALVRQQQLTETQDVLQDGSANNNIVVEENNDTLK